VKIIIRYFNILDFRNATDLFADKDFDGDPIKIKVVAPDENLTGIIDNEIPDGDYRYNEIFPEDVAVTEAPVIRNPAGNPEGTVGQHQKVFVNGIDVSILVVREQYFDQHGKPITTSLKDHTKEIIKGQFATLNDFLLRWNSADQKTAIIEELQQQGVLVEALLDAVNKEVDLFDLICHVAYDQPPMTRKERANNVKKRNYFTKYGEQAKKVLDNLLDKYADEGIEDIESLEVLKVKPFTDYGSPMEIVNTFGSKKEYLNAVHELEIELYKTAN
jgi:type I restriction enzyme R subunit